MDHGPSLGKYYLYNVKDIENYYRNLQLSPPEIGIQFPKVMNINVIHNNLLYDEILI